jgi:hypothetical protein
MVTPGEKSDLANTAGRDVIVKPERLIAFGDIHGELDRLKLLLDRVSPTPADQFVFLADDSIQPTKPTAELKINNSRH